MMDTKDIFLAILLLFTRRFKLLSPFNCLLSKLLLINPPYTSPPFYNYSVHYRALRPRQTVISDKSYKSGRVQPLGILGKHVIIAVDTCRKRKTTTRIVCCFAVLLSLLLMTCHLLLDCCCCCCVVGRVSVALCC